MPRVRLATAQERRFEKLKRKFPDLEFISEYNGVFEIIEVRGIKCKHIWQTTPDLLRRGYKTQCPECKGNKNLLLLEYLKSQDIPYSIIGTDIILPNAIIDIQEKP